MRSIDKDKGMVNSKAAKCIYFDKIVLLRLEKIALQQSTSVSNLVNMLVRRHLMTDISYYKLMAKEYWLKFQELRYVVEQLEAEIEVKKA